jgi:hypothetical protein
MIRQLLNLARFFIVVPVVPPAMLVGFGAATLVGAGALAIGVKPGPEALAPVLLLQLFAAASGFIVPARRGHFDLLLTRGDSRLAIATVHWAMSVLPGILSWAALATTERIYGGTSLTAHGTLLALFIVSTMPWSVTVPLPRLTGSILWLLVFAVAAAALPYRYESPASLSGGFRLQPEDLLFPWILLGRDVHPSGTALVVAGTIAAMLAAFVWIHRMDVPLESGQ